MTEERDEDRRDEADGAREPPPADIDEPMVAGAKRPRRRWRRMAKWIVGVLLAVVLLAALAVGLIEAGTADRFLTARARAGLEQALGEGLVPTLSSARIRIADNGELRLEAQNVKISDRDSAETLGLAKNVEIRLSPMSLLKGRIAVDSLNIEGVRLDPSAFGSGQPIDFNSLRVDDVSKLVQAAFKGADRFLGVLRQGQAGQIRITDTQIAGAEGGGVPVFIRLLTLRESADGSLQLAGTVDEGGQTARLRATARTGRGGSGVEAIDARLSHFDTTPFLMQKDADGAPALGVSTFVDLALSARRGTANGKPTLEAELDLAPGRFYADGTPAEIKGGKISLAYRFDRGSIEIKPSILRIGESEFPFDGGVIDLSKLPERSGKGFAFDLVSNGAVSQPLDSDEPKLPFNGKVFLKYLKDKREFVVDQMAISTPLGSLAGSLQVKQAAKSPEISFVAKIDSMQTTAVKQLWPYWLAVHAREWVLHNLYGGSISNASIKLFVPADKIAENTGDMNFGPEELRIDFDYENARLNVAGDIPPLRDTVGHLKLQGSRLDIALNGATAYFPTGRKVDVSDGVFSIPDTDIHPLMATLDIKVSGKANAVAELVSYRPIDALDRTDYKPSDFVAGDVVSHVTATFGLLQEQNPPPPVWKVDARLDKVDLQPKVDGHDFRNLSGTLSVDPEKAVLDTDAAVDGFPMHVALTEPFKQNSPVKQQRVITATLGDAARKALLPGLNDVLSGPVDVTMTRTGPGRQSVTADLTATAVTVPGIGWTKGAGVRASSSFVTEDDGKVLTVDDFSLKGDGFSASGQLKIAGGNLTSADFDKVKLSAADDFAVRLRRGSDGYRVKVTGSSIDLRSLIKGVKGDGKSGGTAAGTAPVSLEANVDTATGFNGERLGNFDLSYSGRGASIRSLDLKAVTGSGEALVGKAVPRDGGTDVTLSCGDAGALARFADVYAKLQGGLLNARLRKTPKSPYRGTIDLRNFSVKGESRLNSLVNERAGDTGRSLRETVKTPLDLSVAQFQRASARVELGADYLLVSDGILRGSQIGSTFQGTVYDSKGRMNVTGTFMPAYGLNRLFADVPIVGALLGNGRDRGLIGITFRLTGTVSSPKVEVNPLSVIAPGIFRQIFEY